MLLPGISYDEYYNNHRSQTLYNLASPYPESWQLKDILNMADQDTLKLWNNLSLDQTDPIGNPLLRAEIANTYTGLGSNNVLVCTSVEEALFCALNTILVPEAHAITITPCDPIFKVLLQNIGCGITEVPLKQSLEWQLDINDVGRAFEESTKAIIINFPHDPTGAAITESLLRDLIELARSKKIFIFSLETSRSLVYDRELILPSIIELYNRGFVISSVSELGLPGLRIAWAACNEPAFFSKMARYKTVTSVSNSAAAEILGLIAVRSRKLIQVRNMEILENNLLKLEEFIDKHSSLFTWVKPSGGCTAFPLYIGNKMVEELSNKLLEKTGVLIQTPALFEWPHKNFRIGFGKKTLADGLVRFDRFIDEYF